MRLLLSTAVILCALACVRTPDEVEDTDDYVLVEFAARLEEDQETFKRLEGPLAPTAP